MSRTLSDTSATEPVRLADDEHPLGRSARRIGSLRIPLAGPYHPRATLYELPDGRRLWCVRLWEIDRPVRRCVSTGYLRAFARLNRLDRLRREIDDLAGPSE